MRLCTGQLIARSTGDTRESAGVEMVGEYLSPKRILRWDCKAIGS